MLAMPRKRLVRFIRLDPNFTHLRSSSHTSICSTKNPTRLCSYQWAEISQDQAHCPYITGFLVASQIGRLLSTEKKKKKKAWYVGESHGVH